MSDYFEYLDKKMAPKPAYQRVMPKIEKPTEAALEVVPMTARKSGAGDALVQLVKAFWRKQVAR
ncbi:MAG: hypothetical protein M3O26_11595 [Pseudomonadota bacterium]|nr:hypothetical protein [Pseudomonadota bacterium]